MSVLHLPGFCYVDVIINTAIQQKNLQERCLTESSWLNTHRFPYQCQRRRKALCFHPLSGCQYQAPFPAGNIKAASGHGIPGPPALLRKSSQALSHGGKSGDSGTDGKGDRRRIHGSALSRKRGSSVWKMPRIRRKMGESCE